MAKESILRRFLDMDPDVIEFIEELPQETTSLRRSDFPLHVIKMAIFAGFKDKNIASNLIKRRRDLMMRSPTYDILIEEIEKEKKDGWMQEGLQKGLQQGLRQGLQGNKDMIIDALDEKFGEVPEQIVSIIDKIDDRRVLKSLLRVLIRCASIDEFKQTLDKYK